MLLFSLNGRIEMLSHNGDPLEALEQTADFNYFRDWLVKESGYGDGSKGDPPPFDAVTSWGAFLMSYTKPRQLSLPVQSHLPYREGHVRMGK